MPELELSKNLSIVCALVFQMEKRSPEQEQLLWMLMEWLSEVEENAN